MLYGYQCIMCRCFWSCTAAPEQKFEAITKWCPNCLPQSMVATRVA